MIIWYILRVIKNSTVSVLIFTVVESQYLLKNKTKLHGKHFFGLQS